MGRFERWLRTHFTFKEIGWAEIGEQFTRYALWRTRWFNVYLHQLYAPNWHPQCHDHPWSFVTILLRRGYLEEHNGSIKWQRPGKIMYRPATWLHNVVTPDGTAWSLIITTKKSRDWDFKPCTRMEETKWLKLSR